MIKLFRYEGYKVVIDPEALLLKPFKQIWNRDKTQDKNKALMELGFIYFFCDPRSDYQYLIDEDERKKAIKEGEGLPLKWEPDKVVQEAMRVYESFKPTSALLLEDTRFMVNKLRLKLRQMDFDELEVKEFKEITSIVKQIVPLIEDLDKAEKTLTSELKSSSKMRGSGEKTIFEDGLTV